MSANNPQVNNPPPPQINSSAGAGALNQLAAQGLLGANRSRHLKFAQSVERFFMLTPAYFMNGGMRTAETLVGAGMTLASNPQFQNLVLPPTKLARNTLRNLVEPPKFAGRGASLLGSKLAQVVKKLLVPIA